MIAMMHISATVFAEAFNLILITKSYSGLEIARNSLALGTIANTSTFYAWARHNCPLSGIKLALEYTKMTPFNKCGPMSKVIRIGLYKPLIILYIIVYFYFFAFLIIPLSNMI
jgi:hypothetical protein